MEEIEVKIWQVTEPVEDIPKIGTKVWFLPNPTWFDEGTVSEIWTDGDEYYFKVDGWNPDVRWHLSKLIWEE